MWDPHQTQQSSDQMIKRGNEISALSNIRPQGHPVEKKLIFIIKIVKWYLRSVKFTMLTFVKMLTKIAELWHLWEG